MHLKFESKSTVCPKSMFSFVLNFLFWKWNPLIALCTSSPFFLYAKGFAAFNMVLNLGLNSYFLFWKLLGFLSTTTNEDGNDDDDSQYWDQSINLGRFYMALRMPYGYMQTVLKAYSVQATARNLLALLVTDDYVHLLGSVSNVPAVLAFELSCSVWNLRTENCGSGGCRKYFWMRTVKHVTTVLYWSAMCCLLYRRFAGCAFEE